MAQITTGSAGSPGELRGPGLPAVPNNRLAPLPNPSISDPRLADPAITDRSVAPALRPSTPGLNAATTPGFSTTPTAPVSATPGVVIELPPPAALAPTIPATPSSVRTCPTGITFC